MATATPSAEDCFLAAIAAESEDDGLRLIFADYLDDQDRPDEACAQRLTVALRAVIAAPADDTPRLAYAAVCEQYGREERGEFIRVQCELTKLDKQLGDTQFGCAGTHSHHGIAGAMAHGVFHGANPRVPHHHHDERCRDPREALRRRERELLEHNWQNWFKQFGPWDDFAPSGGAKFFRGFDEVSIEARRGFVAEVHLTLAAWCGTECVCSAQRRGPPCDCCNGTGRVGAHGPALVRVAPIEHVTLSDCPPVDLGSSCWAWEPPLPTCLSERIPILSGNLNPPGFSSKELAEAHVSYAAQAWAWAQPAPPLEIRSFTS